MTVDGEHPYISLVNGNVLTLNAAQPAADTIVLARGRIAWVGMRRDLSPAVLASSTVVDCGGQTIIPGFIDAHCHVLAFAVSLVSVDCSPRAVSSIGGIQNAIRERAAITPRGEWIRAAKYSEFDLQEKRHPTRWDLDQAAPNHPVRLNHRSGHACVLNSLALRRVGISSSFEEPDGGTVSREITTGEPDGLLLEMAAWLEGRIPPLSDAELRQAVTEASRLFSSQGITTVMDATVTNSLKRWHLLRRLKSDGSLIPTLSVMPGWERLHEFMETGLTFGYSDELSSLGHAKIMVTHSGGRLEPSDERLKHMVAGAHERGFPVAIHAVESKTVTAAANAISEKRTAGLRDRIEHASECTPDSLSAILRARPVVVSQPAFVGENGDRYLAEMGENARWLYRFRTLAGSGITLAASSDAPVSTPSPLSSIHAAVTRQSRSGRVLGDSERITVSQALKMHTANAAFAVGSEGETGTIAPGKRADIVVLDGDPTRVGPDSSPHLRVTMTICGGEVVWRGE